MSDTRRNRGSRLRNLDSTSMIVTGDLHTRDSPFADDLSIGEQLLEDLCKLAVKHRARCIVLNGDVWHQKDGVNATVLLALRNKFAALKRTYGIPFVWVRGNHEAPWRTNPEFTLMSLFDSVCHTVITPSVLQNDNHIIYLLPWYPGKSFRKLLHNITRKALKESRRKIIIAHVGVTEGTVSPSNYRIQQEVSVRDFCPDLFDYIILGDYHAHQYLGGRKNVLYLGAPIPLTFGDTSNVGPWLLNIQPQPELIPLELPSLYPKYITHEVLKPEDLSIPFYNERHRNRIRCPLSLRARVKELYPNATVATMAEVSDNVDTGRCANIGEADWVGLFKEFHKQSGKDAKHLKLGLKYLKEAIGR